MHDFCSPKVCGLDREFGPRVRMITRLEESVTEVSKILRGAGKVVGGA